MPNILILAGPNGAGKTTSSRTILAETLRLTTFLNADIIAQGLSGFDPDAAAFEASRIMLERMRNLAEQREDFAFETTLAAKTYLPWLKEMQATGYEVHLCYFWLASADLAVARVAERVRQGGHNIPEATIRQRHERSRRNLFELYLPLVNSWRVYDNSQRGMPRLVAWGDGSGEPSVAVESIWREMRTGMVP